MARENEGLRQERDALKDDWGKLSSDFRLEREARERAEWERDTVLRDEAAVLESRDQAVKDRERAEKVLRDIRVKCDEALASQKSSEVRPV